MNKTLKWVLIGLGIALAAFLVTMSCIRFAGYHTLGWMGRSGAYPRMGMMPMMGFFGLFRLLVPLGVLVLAVFGVIHLVRGKATTPPAMIPPAQPVAPVLDVHQCANCGKTYETDGEFCPYCGTKQT